MSDLDELVSVDGVLMAGRRGPDGRVADYKTASLFVANPDSAEMAHWFCSAISTMFGSMAYAVDRVSRTGFDNSSWLPVRSWTYSGGDYSILVRDDQFMIAERNKLGSLDELGRLLTK
jgi:roadblock/LC7 domain-containing protein